MTSRLSPRSALSLYLYGFTDESPLSDENRALTNRNENNGRYVPLLHNGPSVGDSHDGAAQRADHRNAREEMIHYFQEKHNGEQRPAISRCKPPTPPEGGADRLSDDQQARQSEQTHKQEKPHNTQRDSQQQCSSFEVNIPDPEPKDRHDAHIPQRGSCRKLNLEQVNESVDASASNSDEFDQFQSDRLQEPLGL